MSKSVAEYLKMPYERVVIPQESGRFYAKITEFQGCFTNGETAQEALANLEETAAIWIEEELKKGNEIPRPNHEQAYSGKFMLRISPILHQECAENAERDGISLNQYIMQKLSAKTREDSVVHVLREHLKTIRPINVANIANVNFIQGGESTQTTFNLGDKQLASTVKDN